MYEYKSYKTVQPKEIISRRKKLILCHFLATEIIESTKEGLNLKTEQEKKARRYRLSLF